MTRLKLALTEHTGLPHFVPAVSGSSAVEAALRIALVTQYPRTHVVVLRNGFAGKTLLALTGTERPRYRQGIGPLYPHVCWLDPFAPDAEEQLTQLCTSFPVAAIQTELIQGVGGVREIPLRLLKHAESLCRETGCLLFVDEIQTGMFRTGPLLRSQALGLQPDLLTIGKGVSDMMFPSSLTLYSDAVAETLQERQPDFATALCRRDSSPVACASLLNILTTAGQHRYEARAVQAGNHYRELLSQELAGCERVSEIRVFGLLIGIGLRFPGFLARRWPQQQAFLILNRLLQDSEFPLLMGFCQYDQTVLKLTPPLTVTSEEVAASSAAIARAVRTSLPRLLSTLVAASLRLP